MATLSQFAANQRNAQFSTGPKTAEGISHSKLNAIRHGLTGKQIVIKGEDPAEYDAFRSSLVDEYAPSTELEAMLVEQVAQNWWRLNRARKLESQFIAQNSGLDCITDPAISKSFDRLQRYLRAAERSWTHAIQQLDRIGRERERSEAAARPSAAPIGFVSSASPAPVPAATSETQTDPACPAQS